MTVMEPQMTCFPPHLGRPLLFVSHLGFSLAIVSVPFWAPVYSVDDRIPSTTLGDGPCEDAEIMENLLVRPPGITIKERCTLLCYAMTFY
jgi:hypothetical protein